MKTQQAPLCKTPSPESCFLDTAFFEWSSSTAICTIKTVTDAIFFSSSLSQLLCLANLAWTRGYGSPTCYAILKAIKSYPKYRVFWKPKINEINSYETTCLVILYQTLQSVAIVIYEGLPRAHRSQIQESSFAKSFIEALSLEEETP